jgi:hypothetical protein
MNFSLELNKSNGESLSFLDETSIYASVKGTRFVFQKDITSIGGEVIVGGTLEAFYKYIKTSGTAQVYDGKTIGVGGVFIPRADIAVLSGDIFEYLNATVKPLGYLPSLTPLTIVPSDLYLTETIFPNDVYALQYETYVDTTPSTLTTVVDESQYMVVGTGTCVYNGNTYYENEVFIATTNGSITLTGSANLKILSESRNKFFTFNWLLTQYFYQLVLENIGKCCEENELLMNKIQSKLLALEWTNYTQEISISKALQTMNWVEEKITNLQDL